MNELITGVVPDALRETLKTFNACICGARDEGWIVTIGHAVDGLACLVVAPPDSELSFVIEPRRK